MADVVTSQTIVDTVGTKTVMNFTNKNLNIYNDL